MSSNMNGKRMKIKESKKPPQNCEAQWSSPLLWLRPNSYEVRALARASRFQWRISFSSAKDGAWTHVQRTRWPLSHTCCWHRACSFWPPWATPGPPSWPSSFFFLGLLRNISLTALNSGGCLSTTGVLPEVEIFLTRGCIPGAVQHRWPRQQHAGVWGSVCCTCHSPTLLVWGVLCTIQHPHPRGDTFFFGRGGGKWVFACLFWWLSH